MELKFVNESQYEKDIHLYSQRNFLQSSFEGNKMQHGAGTYFIQRGLRMVKYKSWGCFVQNH